MNAVTLKVALLSAASMLTVSCGGGMFNGAEHSLTVAETHPISVDSQVVTLTISVDQTTTDLSNVDKARLRAFADSYMTNGHGPLTVTAPSGAGNDNDGHEAAADIRQALNSAGVPWSAIHGATYRAGQGSGDEVIMTYRNLRTPNMGCATMNNYAAMIADPHDLIAPAETDPRDGESAVRAMELYRDGQVTASAIDKTIDAGTSGN